MYLKARFVFVVFALAFVTPSIAARQVPPEHTGTPASGVVECRVLEAHASLAPAALVVIFHQQQKQDQLRLAALLKENSGSEADIQVSSAAWTKVTIFRLRTCFGRGMLVLPADATKLKDGDTFRIRFTKQTVK